jgi:nicotinamide phosphoribosyltransferase
MRKTNQNRVILGDSYKYSHFLQYEDNVVGMYDYAEARSDKIYPSTVFFGLQYILKKYFSNPITQEEVQEAKEFAQAHGIPFNEEGWLYIVNELDGRLPVRIKAVPEGKVMPVKVPLFTVESTDEKVYWVVSFLETILMKVWYTSNVATRSYFVKQMLMEFADATQDAPFTAYQYHNFGDRGSSSVEAAAIGGMAHLTQFMGTDNFNSLTYVEGYYNTSDISTIGHSIPATEHSTVTSWGKENEMDMIMNHIENNKGAPIIACVMDSYDYFKAVDTVTGAQKFREKIDSDEYPIFVIRPDSGDPAEIIPKTIDIMEKNGVSFSINNKGYKVWDKFRIIWGDGITMESMRTMLEIMVDRGYSSENIAFGSGGWLMQQHDRDTQGWAVKCSNITLRDDEGDYDMDVFKDPITAPGKVSKKGKVSTFKDKVTGRIFVSQVGDDSCESCVDMLETVYENGKMVKEYSMAEVRSNSEA